MQLILHEIRLTSRMTLFVLHLILTFWGQTTCSFSGLPPNGGIVPKGLTINEVNTDVHSPQPTGHLGARSFSVITTTVWGGQDAARAVDWLCPGQE